MGGRIGRKEVSGDGSLRERNTSYHMGKVSALSSDNIPGYYNVLCTYISIIVCHSEFEQRERGDWRCTETPL